jgi:hypothetical protein
MYALADIDFSNRFVVVSELPDEIDNQGDAKQVATDKELEMAVFGAA